MKFYNNVFIAAKVAGANPISAIQIPGKGTTTNVEIKNNIIMNFNSAISTGYSGGTIRGVTIANNILYNNGAKFSWAGTVPSFSESNTITSNPLFVSSSDFYLQSGSPAINKGLSIGLTSDYAGNAITGTPDIGAYEYGSVLGATTYNFTQTLKYGSKGNEVIELQKILIRGGYLKKGNSDGVYGTRTVTAVKEYQRDLGLTSDGIVGLKTREMLNR